MDVLGDGLACGKLADMMTPANESRPLRQALTIAGSDSGGGAGIQADLKAMQANGVFAMSVLTSITAQNSKAVREVFDLPLSIIAAQIDAVFDDFEIASVKTGMLSAGDIVELVADKLKTYHAKNLVVDPVMVSKSGYDLLKPEAVAVLRSRLIPLARLVTPNVQEAERLTERRVRTLQEAKEASRTIREFGCQAVLIKGGHLLKERGCDVLFDGKEYTVLHGEFIDTPHTHGTGCTYASAISAHLARGRDLGDAVRAAKAYITEAIRHALAIGHGHGPVHHFYFLQDPR